MGDQTEQYNALLEAYEQLLKNNEALRCTVDVQIAEAQKSEEDLNRAYIQNANLKKRVEGLQADLAQEREAKAHVGGLGFFSSRASREAVAKQQALEQALSVAQNELQRKIDESARVHISIDTLKKNAQVERAETAQQIDKLKEENHSQVTQIGVMEAIHNDELSALRIENNRLREKLEDASEQLQALKLENESLVQESQQRELRLNCHLKESRKQLADKVESLLSSHPSLPPLLPSATQIRRIADATSCATELVECLLPMLTEMTTLAICVQERFNLFGQLEPTTTSTESMTSDKDANGNTNTDTATGKYIREPNSAQEKALEWLQSMKSLCDHFVSQLTTFDNSVKSGRAPEAMAGGEGGSGTLHVFKCTKRMCRVIATLLRLLAMCVEEESSMNSSSKTFVARNDLILLSLQRLDELQRELITECGYVLKSGIRAHNGWLLSNGGTSRINMLIATHTDNAFVGVSEVLHCICVAFKDLGIRLRSRFSQDNRQSNTRVGPQLASNADRLVVCMTLVQRSLYSLSQMVTKHSDAIIISLGGQTTSSQSSEFNEGTNDELISLLLDSCFKCLDDIDARAVASNQFVIDSLKKSSESAHSDKHIHRDETSTKQHTGGEENVGNIGNGYNRGDGNRRPISRTSSSSMIDGEMDRALSANTLDDDVLEGSKESKVSTMVNEMSERRRRSILDMDEHSMDSLEHSTIPHIQESYVWGQCVGGDPEKISAHVVMRGTAEFDEENTDVIQNLDDAQKPAIFSATKQTDIVSTKSDISNSYSDIDGVGKGITVVVRASSLIHQYPAHSDNDTERDMLKHSNRCSKQTNTGKTVFASVPFLTPQRKTREDLVKKHFADKTAVLEAQLGMAESRCVGLKSECQRLRMCARLEECEVERLSEELAKATAKLDDVKIELADTREGYERQLHLLSHELVLATDHLSTRGKTTE
eukprot:CFRG3178T1